jgi:hydroxyacylglutathione hydrolase
MSKSYQLFQLKTRYLAIINYTYLLVDRISNQALVVDPAWDSEKLLSRLYDLKAELTMILLTHSHFDHTHLIDPLLKRYQTAQVYMSAPEIDFYNFQCPNLQPIYHLDRLTLGETEISCLLTPGHTAGSVCYYTPESLFTGDTIFIEGCGICNTNGGSPLQMYESIQMIKQIITLDTRIFPAHSFGKEPGYPLEYLLQENIYFQFQDPETFTQFRMRKNQTNLFKFC